jgi:hypothetical protein
VLRSYIYTGCRAAAFYLCSIHRVHCAGLSDVHGASQYAMPRGGTFLGSFVGSSDGKMNVQSAYALNTRYKRIC